MILVEGSTMNMKWGHAKFKYTSSWVGFELTPLVVMGTDCTCSGESNYHTIIWICTLCNAN